MQILSIGSIAPCINITLQTAYNYLDMFLSFVCVCFFSIFGRATAMLYALAISFACRFATVRFKLIYHLAPLQHEQWWMRQYLTRTIIEHYLYIALYNEPNAQTERGDYRLTLCM